MATVELPTWDQVDLTLGLDQAVALAEKVVWMRSGWWGIKKNMDYGDFTHRLEKVLYIAEISRSDFENHTEGYGDTPEQALLRAIRLFLFHLAHRKDLEAAARSVYQHLSHDELVARLASNGLTINGYRHFFQQNKVELPQFAAVLGDTNAE